MVIHLLHRIQIACLQPTSTKPSAIHRSSVLLRTFPHPPSASLVLHLFPLLQTNFAIGNPLSLMSSSLSSDSNKLSLSHASFSCLILSDVILDSSSLISSLLLSFSFFPSSSLSSSSLAFTSSRSFCNLCARVITFACTSSSSLMITCGMAFNSAMISGCSKNFSLLPIPATHAHTNDTYGVIVNFT